MRKTVIFRPFLTGLVLAGASMMAGGGASHQAPARQDLSEIIAQSAVISGFAFVAPQEELRQLRLSWAERLATYADEEDIVLD
jgi:poly-gamma-glutamate capsule biosynthesis protein CapA/YwtB (metallophosphatase superfamily)